MGTWLEKPGMEMEQDMAHLSVHGHSTSPSLGERPPLEPRRADEAFLLPLLPSPPPQVEESRSGRVPRGSF